MAEDLGEIRVNIEEEGAQEAADTIGDAVGEGSADGGGAGGAGGGIGGALGGISTKLAGILGFVAFLATLKPIQELLSGLQRLFSVAILPLVALLTTFLRPILQKILRFVADLDFDNLLSSLVTNLGSAIENAISNALGFGIGGGGGRPDVSPLGGPSTTGSGFRQGPFGGSVGRGSVGEDIFIQLGWLDEQSNTSLQSNVAGSNAEVNQRETTGSQ